MKIGDGSVFFGMNMMMLVKVLAIAISGGLGLFVFLRPGDTIEIQRRFYEKINWRIEPISMEKEIRNTKIMGLFLALLTVFAIIYIIFS